MTLGYRTVPYKANAPYIRRLINLVVTTRPVLSIDFVTPSIH